MDDAAGTGAATMQAPGGAGPSPESSELLRRLVVRGMLRGADAAEVDPLVDAGLALAKGPLVMPSPAGTEAVGRALRLPPGGEQEQAVWPLFRTFLPVNRRLRDLCTAWQRRPDGSGNDHSDAAYDAAVRDDLDDVHRKVTRVVRKLDAVVPGLGRYSDLLAGALERLDAGETNMLTSPLTESYHTVWMWLHQELLLLLGVSRAEDERLEEELVSGQPGS